jgi:4-hydroxy-2-oxoglutarate aldolase
LDSDTIISLSNHPNIVGCKLTCGNVGKLQRITTPTPNSIHDKRSDWDSTFATFAGKSDFFLFGLLGNSHGVIAALANLVPKVHVKLLSLYDAHDLEGARALQVLLSEADFTLQTLGVAGVKGALDRYFGYGNGRSRRPLGTLAADVWKTGDEPSRADDILSRIIKVESEL